MTPAKEIDGELWIKADDHHRAVGAARADEREAMVALAAKQGWAMKNEDPFEECVREIADMRAKGKA
jgi:hypothetical protein